MSYEPVWFREKAIAGVAEGLALVTATFGLIGHWWRSHSAAERSV